MSLTSINLGLDELLSDPERRNAFFRTITQDEIASQIRALRKMRLLTQSAFAELAGMKQSAVSRIEQADYAAWNLVTLFRVAEVLNSRWKVILEPAEEAIKEFLGHGDEYSNEGLDGAAAKAAASMSFETRNAPVAETSRPRRFGAELAQ
jgi:transcriptional regulator with XRE-family HTH domain